MNTTNVEATHSSPTYGQGNTSNYLIFVYGTLKRGQPNAKLMKDESTGKAAFISAGKSREKYPLVIASKYNIPFLLLKPGVGHNVIGEVYHVDEKKINFLDEFEGFPGYYDKIETEIILDTTNLPSLVTQQVSESGTIRAHVYFFKAFQENLLSLPFYEDYDSYGPHGLPYDERLEDRTRDEEANVALTEAGTGSVS